MYIRRKAEDNFVKVYPTPLSRVSISWLAHVEATEDVALEHARNGPEFRVGSRKIPVDGYSDATKTVYQFHGCFYHGCVMCKPKNRDVKQRGRTLNQKFKQTEKITQYIKDCGFTVVEMWECKWRQYARSHTITANPYLYPTEQVYRMSERQVLESIQKGLIFGAAEVDIHVPNHLKHKFEEFPPIFKNTTVSLEHIGNHMRGFLEETGQKFSSRRYLVSSMFGEKMLLITPLLNFYIKLGLVVTKVHQIIEFRPKKCFKRFVDQISNDRRAGDRNSAYKAIAETSKLTGV